MPVDSQVAQFLQGHFARAVYDQYFQPIDMHAILAIAQGNTFKPAITVRHECRALLDLCLHHAQFRTIYPLIKGFVRRWLGREGEVATTLLNLLDNRLTRHQIVAQINRAIASILPSMAR